MNFLLLFLKKSHHIINNWKERAHFRDLLMYFLEFNGRNDLFAIVFHVGHGGHGGNGGGGGGGGVSALNIKQ